jgi:hypothetical protein
MYTDIPNDELPDIIKTQIENNKIDEHINKELMEWCKIIINQNYFQLHGEIYTLMNGLAGLSHFHHHFFFSDICLQHLEHTKIISNLINQHIFILDMQRTF